MQNSQRTPVSCVTAVALAAVLATGCASSVAPTALQRPQQPTCFELATPVAYLKTQGLLKWVWETRLERGPYVAEREDAQGTYFRGPPGGVSYARPDQLNEKSSLFTHITYDGGIWVPRDAAGTPRIYTYFTTQAVPPVVPPATATCATVQLTRDAREQGIDAIGYGATVETGVTQALAAQTAGTMKVSTGQAAGAGAAGGVIGGLIVASIINSDVGKIQLQEPEKNAEFNEVLRAAAAKAVPLPAASTSSSAVAVTEPDSK